MTKFLSLDWFKSKVNIAVDNFVSSRLDKLQEHDDESLAKPYLNVKMVNDVLTIVMTDGAILSKTNSTFDDYQAVRAAKSEYEIMVIIGSQQIFQEKAKERLEVKRMNALVKGIEILKNRKEFYVENDSVYFTGMSRSLPQIMVEELIELVSEVEETKQVLTDNEKFQSLNRFFMWCCLNPRAEVADELYRFLKDNSFRITKQGFFVALRNVVTLHGSPELVHFISNCYNKVKAVWRDNPDDYFIFLKDGEYSIVKKDAMCEMVDCDECGGTGFSDETNYEGDYYDCGECDGTGAFEVENHNYGQNLGNLTQLYLDLPNREENRFTDDWTKTFDIRIGKVVNMPLEDCNWSTQDCAAAGLHFTADQIHYVGCGDQSVLVLINPMKVVGIGAHKGRCYEYLPIMTVPRDEATAILHDIRFDTLALDEDYAIRELEGLAEKAEEGFVVETKKHQFSIPTITLSEIKNITASLSEMKAQISRRVSRVV